MYTIEEFDNLKTKILKYIMFKKRTEKEVKQKFAIIDNEQILQDVIDNLKEIGYINDFNYIQRAVTEHMSLNNLSIREIKYKLYSKGIENDIIETYINEHVEEMEEYEEKSATNLFLKKKNLMDENSIKEFLLKKGYKVENVKKALRKEYN